MLEQGGFLYSLTAQRLATESHQEFQTDVLDRSYPLKLPLEEGGFPSPLALER